jgi:hypothetical protein
MEIISSMLLITMLNWLRRLRIGYLWTTALDLASKEKYQQALARIESIENMSGRYRIYEESKLYIYILLLKGGMLHMLDKNKEAIDSLEKAQRQILQKINPDSEMRYLRRHCAILAHMILREGIEGKTLVEHRSHLFDIPIDPVDLSAVPEHIKRNFPLPRRYYK